MSEIQERINKLQAISDWLNEDSNTMERLLKLRLLHDDWEYVSEERWQTFLVDAEEVLYYLRARAEFQLRDAIDSADPKNQRSLISD